MTMPRKPKATKHIVAPREYWKIAGYDGTRKTFDKVLPQGVLTEGEVITLLQRLASRNLTENEIVAASLRRNSKGYAPFLEAHIDSNIERDPKRPFSIMVADYLASQHWAR